MSDLRERLAKIEALGEFDAWSRTDEILDAAVAVVAQWLDDLAKSQWDRSANHPWDQSRDMATIRAMYLTDLADSLTRKEPTP